MKFWGVNADKKFFYLKPNLEIDAMMGPLMYRI